MKDKRVIIVISLILVFIIGVIVVFFLSDEEPKQEPVENNDIKEVPKECPEDIKLYLELDNYNIYTKCLDNINITENDIDAIVAELNYIDMLNDGGTTIYQGFSNIINQDITLIKCNTKAGNRDVYIGLDYMEYEEGFCQSNGVQSFTRTFEVLNVADSNDESYLYLTLREYQGEVVETVKFLRELCPDIAEGNNYEFTFESPIPVEDDSITSLFANTNLISIVQTDKTGMDQIQDSFGD